MPVLPDVASMIVRPAMSLPDASPSRIIRAAARSFTDPPGFCHSAFAYSSTPGVSRSNRRSRTSGVRPMRSTTEEPALRSRTGQSGDEDMTVSIYDRTSPELYQPRFRCQTRWWYASALPIEFAPPFAILAAFMASTQPTPDQADADTADTI